MRSRAAIFFIALLQLAVIAAAQTRQVMAAPIPTQILTAKKIFIANAGGDDRWNEGQLFGGGADRSYNQFYTSMKSAGRYELVGSPAEADLIFEIQFLFPTGEPAANRGETLATVAFDPQFRLVIRDPKTNVLLWGFTEHVQWAILQSNRDKNFDQAAARIVSDVQSLALRSAAVANAVKP
jgi:hypothetical protein